MLPQLSGQTYQVYTAICLQSEQVHHAVNISEMQFNNLNEQEIITEVTQRVSNKLYLGVQALLAMQAKPALPLNN